MPDKSNEQIEREALESLVAADLSAKMKQWRNQPPPPDGNGNKLLRIFLLLLFFGGAAWWLWPDAPAPAAPPQPPAALPATESPQTPATIPAPMAKKNVVTTDRFLALAQSNYQAPNFAADIRGDAPSEQDALNDAREALAAKRPADALNALKQAPAAYKTDADYLRAHALFALRKYTQAGNIFGQLTGSIRYGEAAEWYETLSMIPAFPQQQAQIIRRLKKIADDNGHTFQREAQQLLKGL